MTEYFGKGPDGYQKPLYAADNFSDVLDKALARTNLGAASVDDVLKAANPIGTIIAFYGSTAPYGYLPCSGQTVSSATFPELVSFLGGGASATLPDLRGEFLRGWDNGRGIDNGRSLGALQLDAFQNITGTLETRPLSGGTFGSIYSATGVFNGTPTSSSQIATSVTATGSGVAGDSFTFDASRMARTSSETRPRNVSVLYCIKAYDTPVNPGTLDIGALASDLIGKVSLTDFNGSNSMKQSTGYQKLPGGLIIQWGSVTRAASSSGTYFYPIAFNTVLNLSCSIGQTTLAPAGTPCASISMVNNGQFSIQNTYSASLLVIYWIAIGY